MKLYAEINNEKYMYFPEWTNQQDEESTEFNSFSEKYVDEFGNYKFPDGAYANVLNTVSGTSEGGLPYSFSDNDYMI